jgi:rhodanese-related sulfurtransferase
MMGDKTGRMNTMEDTMGARSTQDRRVVPGKVLGTVPAPPAEARAYFDARLRCETDPSDVWADLGQSEETFVLVDTRSADAFREGHLPGAINLPHGEIDEDAISVLPEGRPAVTYCWGPGCNAGTKGALKLASLGVPVKEMIGGFEYWVKEGYPVETS